MLPRVLEPEVMDTPEEARDYDSMDHGSVNRTFVADFLALHPNVRWVLDVGAGTAQIPIHLCQTLESARVLAIDLAEAMLTMGRENVQKAGLDHRLQLECVDAKQLPYPPGVFSAGISNSIVHHIPRPEVVLAELVRVVEAKGWLFVRDLLRPADHQKVEHLVQTYASGANAHQRQMFADSLCAALTLDEIRALVHALGFSPNTVQQTTDRHWTWTARKP